MVDLECKICYENQSPKYHYVAACCKQNLCCTCWNVGTFKGCPFCRNGELQIIHYANLSMIENDEKIKRLQIKYNSIMENCYIAYGSLLYIASISLMLYLILNGIEYYLQKLCNCDNGGMITSMLITLLLIIIMIGFIPLIIADRIIVNYLKVNRSCNYCDIIISLYGITIILLILQFFRIYIHNNMSNKK